MIVHELVEIKEYSFVLKKAREWVARSWWGIAVCYPILICFFYLVIWAAIEPLGIPDKLAELPWILQHRAFYHVLIAVFLASHMTLLLDLLARRRGWGRWAINHETANKAVEVEISSSLIEWQTGGALTPDLSHDPPDLRVTNSDNGGILRETLTWTDYQFEFETKIDNANSSWIVRAHDLDNYVMLQCSVDKIIPHYRRDGLWWRESETPLPPVLPKGWFKVSITVQMEAVEVCLEKDGKSTILFRADILGPRTASLIACRPSDDKPTYKNGEVFLSYLRGGVGFRASGNESAYFRNITVRQI